MAGIAVSARLLTKRASHRQWRSTSGKDGRRAMSQEDVPVRAALEGTTYRGPDAGTQYCMAVSQSWEDLRWEVEELRDGQGWVLAVGHIRGQGRDSGAAIDAKAGWLAHFRDGLITRFQTFANRKEALEAAGLRE
jgi:ketosteroid isomerase-like protein